MEEGIGDDVSGAEKEKTRWFFQSMTAITHVHLLLVVSRTVLILFEYGSPEDVVSNFMKARVAQPQLFFLTTILGMGWLYRAWTRIPSSCRLTHSERSISPGQAVGRLLIPFYNLYWMYVVNLGLCGALDRHARRLKSPLRGPSLVALTACIVQTLPFVSLVVAPIFWCAFMVCVDLIQDDLGLRQAKRRRRSRRAAEVSRKTAEV
ncbi:DUF4328 domain-containing protein [Chondromyces crocatus]|uniref:DUF4328 domain-containing protein n=1 Tax=Chondromyces crocatus TaxID=52 RepID=A0A0K1ESF7_CHOCO|nr:DUF4328 domain-containing protein [Chondromyces crocatus]AKT43729.1 uncharacterized protein CMC5_079640 [Chondromyces crocatus]